MKLNKFSKICNIHHADWDGKNANLVLLNYFEHVTSVPATFSNVDKILLETKFEEYDKVILTDIFPKDPEVLNISKKILVLDHHQESSKLCNMNNIFAFTDNCGAVLTKNWVEATFNVDLSHLNLLLKYTNDYDLWIHNHPKSKMLEILFWKYLKQGKTGFDKYAERFKDGNVRFTDDEIKYLKHKRFEFRKLYDNLEVFELEKINGCIICVKEFINDIADKLLKKDGYEIVIIQNVNNSHVSIRTKDDNVNIGEVLQNLEIGGGHRKSGGITDYFKFKEDVSKLEKYLYENVTSWRK
jgi:hypothetical protein